MSAGKAVANEALRSSYLFPIQLNLRSIVLPRSKELGQFKFIVPDSAVAFPGFHKTEQYGCHRRDRDVPEWLQAVDPFRHRPFETVPR